MKIAVIDYGAGNVQSVLFALKRLGYEGKLTHNSDEIISSGKIIFPGVGEAGSAMLKLREKGLDKLIPQLKQPVLGICLGLQLLCLHSEESNTDCLGIFPVKVKKFISPENEKIKIPHVGWNSCSDLKSELFNGIKEHQQFYFVHGYYAESGEDTVAFGNYILPFSAALQKNNFFAVQFHPEKSGEAGEALLRNFLSI